MACCGTRKIVVAKVAMLLYGVDLSPGRASLPDQLALAYWMKDQLRTLHTQMQRVLGGQP